MKIISKSTKQKKYITEYDSLVYYTNIHLSKL